MAPGLALIEVKENGLPFSQESRMIRQAVVSAMIVFALVFGGAEGLAAEDGGDDGTAIAFAAQSLGTTAEHITLGPPGDTGRAVLVDGQVAGFLGSTWDIASTAGYSGRPIDVLVMVDTSAVIRGARIVAQQEPVLTLGIAPDAIDAFASGFAGYDLKESFEALAERRGVPDAIAGATISSGVIRAGILRTARTLANQNGLMTNGAGRTINMAAAQPVAWKDLLARGAVASLHVTAQQVDNLTGVAGNAAPESTFIDLYVAVADPPEIGLSLLGEGGYSEFAGASAGGHGLLLAANGLYSFKGTSWRKTGVFERIEIEQAGRSIALTREQHHRLPGIEAAGAPEIREAGLFVLPAATGFDPAEPFRLSLMVTREDAAGTPHSARFNLDYALPSAYLVAPPAQAEPEPPPLWQENWRARIVAIGVIAAMLLALYVILIFQNQIAARPKLYRVVRLGYLSMTVIVLGGLMGAQLSVVHVLTFVQALRGQFSWETFLLDPVIFVTWSWVAVALLFWGRVYCGWLCPFGALQEVLNKLAKRLHVPQFSVPFLLHERLWPIKYIIFLGLFAVSLASMTMAFKAAETEPFKTVVTLRFMREWPFVIYALVLLAAGLFVERFYCRYLCPLGAALAIPARLRMFEWLKRRPQCGRECRICSTKCPVQAIHPEGQINPNECIYCLNCQTLYYDEHICPPLKARAARRPMASAAAAAGAAKP